MAPVDLLLLDCHGVVLNNPFGGFLADCARVSGRSRHQMDVAWRGDLRRAAWLGQISDAALWVALRAQPYEPESFERVLEPRYERGPAAPALARWRRLVPVWMLSNHRAAWLRPRLARLGVAQWFQRLLISDEIGVVKPASSAFDVARDAAQVAKILFVDNRARNVDAARCAGMTAVHAHGGADWVGEIDRAIVGG